MAEKKKFAFAEALAQRSRQQKRRESIKRFGDIENATDSEREKLRRVSKLSRKEQEEQRRIQNKGK